MPVRLLGILFCCLLPGCGLVESSLRGAQTVQQDSPRVILPPADPAADPAALAEAWRRDIKVASEATANQQQGLVNAAISRVTDKITGVEAAFTTQLKGFEQQFQLRDAKLEGDLSGIKGTLTARLDAEITGVRADVGSVRLEAQTQVKLLEARDLSMTNRLDRLELDFKAQAAGNAGINNRLDQLQQDFHAGRDINYFPKEAVYVVLGILAAVQAIALGALGYAYRNARFREANYARLLMTALAVAKSDDCAELLTELKRDSAQMPSI